MADELHLTDEQLAEAKRLAEEKRRIQEAKRALDAIETANDLRWSEAAYGTNTVARGFLVPWHDLSIPAVQSVQQPVRRVHVDARTQMVTIDTSSYSLKGGPVSKERLATFIQALIDADGEHVSAKDYDVRPRDIESQCDQVRDLIGSEAKPGAGHRIPRDKLWRN